MRGVYQEISRPERLVSTEALTTTRANPSTPLRSPKKNGKTTVTTRVLYDPMEIRDAVIRSGMEHGAAETYDRLVEPSSCHGRRSWSSPACSMRRANWCSNVGPNPSICSTGKGAPRGFTVTSSESDIRPGGFFRICMRSPEGVDSWLEGEYREIVKPERLVFTHAWLDAKRKPGKETLVTITLAERDGKTELTLRQTGFPSVESRDGHKVRMEQRAGRSRRLSA